jgi:GyrI-like small molecule binding domain
MHRLEHRNFATLTAKARKFICREASGQLRKALGWPPARTVAQIGLPLTILTMVRAQIMHVGPYSEERPTIERLHAFITEEGYSRRGKHHEIYLGDPRRTAPERLRTSSDSLSGRADRSSPLNSTGKAATIQRSASCPAET